MNAGTGDNSNMGSTEEEGMGKAIQKWADDFMFEAEEIDASNGPEVFLLQCNSDPLGSIAAAAKAYMGEFVGSLSEITDEERRHYLGEVQKTALAMPLESVNFHFRIKGVTRGFTHQMVRQRTAAYSQESTRFAVKTGVPVGLPPSLVGTLSREEWRKKDGGPGKAFAMEDHISSTTEEAWLEWEERYASKQQKWRFKWDEMMNVVADGYNTLVNEGMPAEDARGALPTNLLTQLNYFTNLRNLQVEAGKRLCTQAQFEWRIVLSRLVEAIREYGKTQWYQMTVTEGWINAEPTRAGYYAVGEEIDWPSSWQFEALADIFRPVCYLENKCPFKADFDRKCSIRSRVDAFAENGVPSSEWGRSGGIGDDNRLLVGKDDKVLLPIQPAEWLMDPAAAR